MRIVVVKNRAFSKLQAYNQGKDMNQTVNDGVAHSRIGTLDQPVAA